MTHFFCVCVCVCACVCMCVWDLCFPSALVFHPPFLLNWPQQQTTVFLFFLNCLGYTSVTRHWTAMQKNPESWHTCTHTLLPDMTQYAHIPALPHLSQQLCVCVCVYVCACVCVCVLCCVVCLVSLAPGEQNKATWDWRTSECYVYSSSSLHQRGRRLHASMQWGFYPSCSCVHIDKLLPSAVLLHVYFISTGFLHLTSALKSHAWRKHCGHTTDGK